MSSIRNTRSIPLYLRSLSFEVILSPVSLTIHPVTPMIISGFFFFSFWINPRALSSDFCRTEQVFMMRKFGDFCGSFS